MQVQNFECNAFILFQVVMKKGCRFQQTAGCHLAVLKMLDFKLQITLGAIHKGRPHREGEAQKQT